MQEGFHFRVRLQCLNPRQQQSSSGISGVECHGKHTRANEHAKKIGEQNFLLVKFGQADVAILSGPNFFTCSVTPCMLVHVHYHAMG